MSLCAAGEQPWFTCSLTNGKQVALCGADGKSLRYRFGKPGSLELEFPEPAAGAGDASGLFRYWVENHAQSQSLHVAFRNADVEYDIFDQLTYGSERDHGAGIRVTRHGGGPWGEGTELATLLCSEDSAITRLEELSGVLPGR